MLTNVSIADLNCMDLGAHMYLMEEWNERTDFGWQPAMIIHHGFYTRVIQETSDGALIIATYIANGEGDLLSLRLYTDTPLAQALDPARASAQWVKDDLEQMNAIGNEMLWTDGMLHRNRSRMNGLHTRNRLGQP